MDAHLEEIVKKYFPNKQLPNTYEAFIRELENQNIINDVESISFFYGDTEYLKDCLIRCQFHFQWKTICDDERKEKEVQAPLNANKETSQKGKEIDIFFDFNEYIETDEFKQRMEEHSSLSDHQYNKVMVTDYQETNDIGMRNDIVESNLGLVESIVQKYSWAVHATSLTDEDLVNYGIIGLMKAIDKFDPMMGYEFSTYAYHWIRQAISRAIADEGYVVRIPVHMQEAINKLRKLEIKFYENPEKINMICKEMEITEDKYREISYFQHAYRHMDSLNALMLSGESQDERMIFIESDHALYFNENEYGCPPEDLVVRKVSGEEIMHLANLVLTLKEMKVINYRFGMITGRNETLEFIGRELGVTRERIRQIEAIALTKLKKYIEKNEL